MRNIHFRGLAFAALTTAAALLAACSGGGNKSLPPTTQPMSGATATTTLTIVIGGPGTQAAVRHGQTIPASNSKSVVIRYVGDPNPASAPTNPFGYPSTAPAATGTPVNLTTGAGGNCALLGGQLTCTITGVVLPVGVIDLYVLDYDNTGGTGNLIYGSVTTVQVNSNGTLTAPGTTSPVVSPNALSGNVAAAGANIAFSPTSLTLTPSGSAAATASPFPLSAAIQITATDANGNPITGAINAITVTNADTSGNTCLEYQASGSGAATPCPFPSAGATTTATVTNTGDKIFVQYNNKPMSILNTFNLSAPQPATGATPNPITAKVTFTASEFATAATPANPVRALAALTTKVFAATNVTAGTPATSLLNYNFSSGALTAGTAISGTLTHGIGSTPGNTGSAGTNLVANITGMVVGPDNNVWFVEPGPYVGVYAVTGSASGGLITTGNVGESAVIGGLTGTTPAAIATSGGYIWVLTTANDVIRVDPTNLQNTGSTGVVIAKSGSGNNLPVAFPSTGVFNGGVAVASGAFYAPTNGGTVVKFTPLTGATIFPASGTVYTESPPVAAGVPFNGALAASDGNFWTAVGGANNGFAYVNASATTISQVATGPTGAQQYGSLVQSGPDNLIFTLGTTGLIYTNTGGSKVGTITGAAACNASANAPTGEGLLSLSGYVIAAPSTANLCVAVP